MSASEHAIDVVNIEESIGSLLNAEDSPSNAGIGLELREALVALPAEQSLAFSATKLHQQLLDSFSTYESHQTNFVVERDMPNVIYSLGFVPVSRFMCDRKDASASR
jgi:hypothetical protein